MLAKGHVMYYSNASCAANMPMSHCIPRTVKQQQEKKKKYKKPRSDLNMTLIVLKH